MSGLLCFMAQCGYFFGYMLCSYNDLLSYTLTLWAASPEAYWAQPHRVCLTVQVWEQGWREIWMVMDCQQSFSWSWGSPLCSEHDEGSEVWGSALAAHLQSDEKHKCHGLPQRKYIYVLFLIFHWVYTDVASAWLCWPLSLCFDWSDIFWQIK